MHVCVYVCMYVCVCGLYIYIKLAVYVLSCPWNGARKIPCCQSVRISYEVTAAGFFSRFLSDPQSYVQCHINAKKTFASFLMRN